MLSSVSQRTRVTLTQLPRASLSSCAINRTVATRYLSALQHLGYQPARPHSLASSPTPSRRGFVTQSILQQLRQTPVTDALRSTFRFHREGMADVATDAMHTAVLAKLKPEEATRKALAFCQNPTVRDVEALVAQHGPVSLSLHGMLPPGEGGSSASGLHTVLVMYTFRDEHGCCLAVVADGNPRAKNPVKEFVAGYAQRLGKQLHELGPRDYACIDQQLAGRGEPASLEQAFYDIINLDRAFEAHHATVIRYDRFFDILHKDLIKAGLHYSTARDIKTEPAALAYAQGMRIDGKLPDAVAAALLDQIKHNPDAVKPFVALQSPAANTDLFEQVPAVQAVFNARSLAGIWSPPQNIAELKDALRQEPTLAGAMDDPDNQPRIAELFEKITATTLPPNHRGVSLKLQFPVTYGHVAHIAPINLWREQTMNGQPGALKMGCLHQEATQIAGKVWEGEVHATFDTSNVHPSGLSPVAESIKFTGMPNITKVMPCKYPDKIVPLAAAMSGPENGYPYGGTPSWHGDKGRFPQDRPFNSCSNTSYETHMICNGEYPVYQSTLPELWMGKIGELYNIDLAKIQTCKIGDTVYQVKDMLTLPFDIVGAMWPKVTIHSATLPCAVRCTFEPEHPEPHPLDVGNDLRLPSNLFPEKFRAARFINPTQTMRLADGTPIKNGVTYFAEQLRQGIVYSNDKTGKKIDYWISGVEK